MNRNNQDLTVHVCFNSKSKFVAAVKKQLTTESVILFMWVKCKISLKYKKFFTNRSHCQGLGLHNLVSALHDGDARPSWANALSGGGRKGWLAGSAYKRKRQCRWGFFATATVQAPYRRLGVLTVLTCYCVYNCNIRVRRNSSYYSAHTTIYNFIQ